MRRGIVLCAGLLAGCETDSTWGWNIDDEFTLDGTVRTWEYAADDTTDHLVVDKVATEIVGDLEVVTLEHSLVSDDGEHRWVADVRWSNHSQGVWLHGYTDSDGEVSFEPAILFGEAMAHPGDVVQTFSAGRRWTATFEGFDGCATFWVPGWGDENCLVVTLSDGDDDPATHGVVTGTYHLVPLYGPAWLDLDGYDELWRLYAHDWEQ